MFSAEPSASNIKITFLIQNIDAAPQGQQRLRRRQTSAANATEGYITADGTAADSSNCNVGTTYTLNDAGMLGLQDQTAFYSTDPGVASAPFAVMAQLLSISGAWVIEGTNLVWQNANFTGGQAIICKRGALLEAYYTEAPPADCTLVQLSLLQGSRCRADGTVAPESGGSSAQDTATVASSGSLIPANPGTGSGQGTATATFASFDNTMSIATSPGASSTGSVPIESISSASLQAPSTFLSAAVVSTITDAQGSVLVETITPSNPSASQSTTASIYTSTNAQGSVIIGTVAPSNPPASQSTTASIYTSTNAQGSVIIGTVAPTNPPASQSTTASIYTSTNAQGSVVVGTLASGNPPASQSATVIIYTSTNAQGSAVVGTTTSIYPSAAPSLSSAVVSYITTEPRSSVVVGTTTNPSSYTSIVSSREPVPAQSTFGVYTVTDASGNTIVETPTEPGASNPTNAVPSSGEGSTTNILKSASPGSSTLSRSSIMSTDTQMVVDSKASGLPTSSSKLSVDVSSAKLTSTAPRNAASTLASQDVGLSVLSPSPSSSDTLNMTVTNQSRPASMSVFQTTGDPNSLSSTGIIDSSPATSQSFLDRPVPATTSSNPMNPSNGAEVHQSQINANVNPATSSGIADDSSAGFPGSTTGPISSMVWTNMAVLNPIAENEGASKTMASISAASSLSPLHVGGDSTLRTSVVAAKAPVTNSLSPSTDASTVTNTLSQNDAATAHVVDGAFDLSGKRPRPNGEPNISQPSPQSNTSPGDSGASNSVGSFAGSDAPGTQDAGTGLPQSGSAGANEFIPIASGAGSSVFATSVEAFAAASSAAAPSGNAATSSPHPSIHLPGGVASADPSVLASSANTLAGGSIEGFAKSSSAGPASSAVPGAADQPSNTALIPPSESLAGPVINGQLAFPTEPQASAGKVSKGQSSPSTEPQVSVGALSNGRPAPTAQPQANVDANGPEESNAAATLRSGSLSSEASNGIVGPLTRSSAPISNSMAVYPTQNNVGKESTTSTFLMNGVGASPSQTSPPPGSSSVNGVVAASPSQSSGTSPAIDENFPSQVQNSLLFDSSAVANGVALSTSSNFATSHNNPSSAGGPSLQSATASSVIGVDGAALNNALPDATGITASPQFENDTSGPLPNSGFVAPLSQSNAVQDFVRNVLSSQPNITAFENELEARLGGYLNDYIASQEDIQQPSDGQTTASGTADMQNLGVQNCDNLTQIHERMVTDIYIMEVIANTTYQHYQQVKDVIIDECR